MLLFTPDDSVMGPDGATLFFSRNRFVHEICQGNHCFLCGVPPGTASFNDEHVIPDWILRRWSLHEREIILPNGSKYKYGRYKVPCCRACNTFLGREVEQPVSQLVAGGYDTVAGHVDDSATELTTTSGPWLFFVWMMLIFLKLHLKDKELRLMLGHDAVTERISDMQDWSGLHHMHCVIRTLLTKAVADVPILGSFFLVRAKTDVGGEPFDFRSYSNLRVMAIRLDDVCMIICLDDAGLGKKLLEQRLPPLTAALSQLQQLELLAQLGYVNQSLSERPQFATEVDALTGDIQIVASVPDGVSFEDDPTERGAITHDLMGSLLGRLPVVEVDDLRSKIKSGRYSFLRDQEGNFIECQF